jgi:putative heme iron utilization protein
MVSFYRLDPTETNLSKREHKERMRQLLLAQRWAALATLNGEHQPEASMVAYVVNESLSEVYLHLSTLAGHTRNLARQPRASLVITECDQGDNSDPQQLARASLSGSTSVIEYGSEGYDKARRHYLERLPDAEPLFDFADFRLFRFSIARLRFVGGFAQAYSYTPAEL